MSLHIDNANIDEIYYGKDAISEVWQNGILIWQGTISITYHNGDDPTVEIYKHKKRKPFYLDLTNFKKDGYFIIGWNEYGHRYSEIPDYPINSMITGFQRNIDLYACWNKIEYNIYFFNINANLIRSNYLPDDLRTDFIPLRTDHDDFICYELLNGVDIITYPLQSNFTVLPTPSQIGINIPSGYELDKWVELNDNISYNVGDLLQNTGYDKFLYPKWIKNISAKLTHTNGKVTLTVSNPTTDYSVSVSYTNGTISSDKKTWLHSDSNGSEYVYFTITAPNYKALTLGYLVSRSSSSKKRTLGTTGTTNLYSVCLSWLLYYKDAYGWSKQGNTYAPYFVIYGDYVETVTWSSKKV